MLTRALPGKYGVRNAIQERINLASKHPDIVSQLSKQMATYVPYVDPSLSTEELSKYDCLTTNVSGGVFPSPWWGEFNGPVRAYSASMPTTYACTVWLCARADLGWLPILLQCCRPKRG